MKLLAWGRGSAILLEGWTWPIDGFASGRVCACSLHSRLVYNSNEHHKISSLKHMAGGRGFHLTDLGLQLNVVSDAWQLDWRQGFVESEMVDS